MAYVEQLEREADDLRQRLAAAEEALAEARAENGRLRCSPGPSGPHLSEASLTEAVAAALKAQAAASVMPCPGDAPEGAAPEPPGVASARAASGRAAAAAVAAVEAAQAAAAN